LQAFFAEKSKKMHISVRLYTEILIQITDLYIFFKKKYFFPLFEAFGTEKRKTYTEVHFSVYKITKPMEIEAPWAGADAVRAKGGGMKRRGGRNGAIAFPNPKNTKGLKHPD